MWYLQLNELPPNNCWYTPRASKLCYSLQVFIGNAGRYQQQRRVTRTKLVVLVCGTNPPGSVYIQLQPVHLNRNMTLVLLSVTTTVIMTLHYQLRVTYNLFMFDYHIWNAKCNIFVEVLWMAICSNDTNETYLALKSGIIVNQRSLAVDLQLHIVAPLILWPNVVPKSKEFLELTRWRWRLQETTVPLQTGVGVIERAPSIKRHFKIVTKTFRYFPKVHRSERATLRRTDATTYLYVLASLQPMCKWNNSRCSTISIRPRGMWCWLSQSCTYSR